MSRDELINHYRRVAAQYFESADAIFRALEEKQAVTPPPATSESIVRLIFPGERYATSNNLSGS